jgi:hypothetical protein
MSPVMFLLCMGLAVVTSYCVRDATGNKNAGAAVLAGMVFVLLLVGEICYFLAKLIPLAK